MTVRWLGLLLMLLAPEALANLGHRALVLKASASELHLSWRIDGRAACGRAPRLEEYRALVRGSGIDLHPWRTLARQAEYYRSRREPELRREAENMQIVLTRTVGAIRSIDCLERGLFEVFLGAFGGRASESEFIAYVLRRGTSSGEQRKIYFSTATDLRQLNRSQGAFMLPEHVLPDLESGWTLESHLHNHSFRPGWSNGEDLSRDWGGGAGPSLSDVGFYRDFALAHGLRSARVTNGFVTGVFSAAEFSRFITHEN